MKKIAWKPGVLLISWFAYGIVTILFAKTISPAIITLVVIPILISGLLTGLAGGVLSGLVASVYNILLIGYVSPPFISVFENFGLWLGNLIGILIGAVIGRVRDLGEALRSKDRLLGASEERFRKSLDGIPEGCQIIGFDRKFRYVNEAVVERLHIEKQNIIGRTAIELGIVDRVERVHELIEKCLDERVGFNHEEQLTSPDGRLRWIDFSIRPVPEGAFVLSVDETERKDAEERVLQSESRYRQLFDSSAISNWAQDMSGVKLRLDGLKSKGITDVRKYFTDHPDALREVTFSQEIVEVNESTLKMFGAKSREELIADFPKIFSYETMDATIELLATIAGGRSYWERVTKANTLDGRLIDIRVFALLPQHEEAFKNVLFSVIDITQERKARDAISESESRYRKLFDSSAVGNWSQDLSKVKSKLDALEAKGVKDLREYLPKHHEDFREIVGSMRLVDVNDTAIRMFGAKSKRELKSQVSKIFSQTPQEKTVDFLATIAEGGRYWEMENRFSTLDGGEIDAHTFSTLPNIDDENPLMLVSIIDVTETKQLEVQKLEAIGKASSSIAHDIRNPLTAIRTAGYVMRDAPTKKRGEMLDVIDTNIVKADDIIQSLMDFSSPAPLKAEEVNFKIILEEVLEQCVIPKNIRLVKRYEKVSRAKFDPRQMSRALTNLIMNAIQAMPGGGRLTIASKQDEGFIETQIKDTGIGISKKNLGKLFTPFFTTKAKGTGLGLLNAEAIIKRHGGTLELESIKNRSTTVTVRIPAISK